jgi:hypothetical protein
MEHNLALLGTCNFSIVDFLPELIIAVFMILSGDWSPAFAKCTFILWKGI